jgi:aminobenzoyl-glutamate transport protein
MPEPPAPDPTTSAPASSSPASSGFVEWLGNLLPHPVTLFAILALGVILVSGLAEFFGVSVADPRPEGCQGGRRTAASTPISLMNADGFRRIVQNVVSNFTGFAPLGTVLVALLGVGVAEKSGLIRAAIRGIVLGAAVRRSPRTSALAAILSPPARAEAARHRRGRLHRHRLEHRLRARLRRARAARRGRLHSMGRHPLAGLAAAFAAVSGGYSANVLIGTIDPLLAGLTQEAAQLIAPDYSSTPR